MWLFLALLSCSLAAEVTLIVRYPSSNLKGQSLYIRGDALGLNWNQGVQFSYQGSDTWSIALSYSPSGTSSLNFKTLVGDSVWQIGANEQVSLSSSTTSFTSYPFFFTEEGNYAVTTSLQSERLGNSRDVIVYYPPSYFENTLKIYSDVLIMHDGQNIFNDSTSFGGRSWRCKETIDQLINEGNMREVLVVGLYNTPNRIDEYTYSKDPQYGGGNGNIYLDFIESRALPWIQKNLRVATNPRYGILGSSLGGLISCYAGWTRSHVYSIAGCMSSSFWWNSQDFNTTVLSLPKPPASTFFYLDSGDSGPSKDDEVETITVRDHVLNLGWQEGENLWYFLARGGTHNEYSWGERFYVPMTDLYPPLPLEN